MTYIGDVYKTEPDDLLEKKKAANDEDFPDNYYPEEKQEEEWEREYDEYLESLYDNGETE